MPRNGKSYLFKSSIGAFVFSWLFIIEWFISWINSRTLFEIMIYVTLFVWYLRMLAWKVTGYGWFITLLKRTICKIRLLNKLLLRHCFDICFIINFLHFDWLPYPNAKMPQLLTFINHQSAFIFQKSWLLKQHITFMKQQSALME